MASKPCPARVFRPKVSWRRAGGISRTFVLARPAASAAPMLAQRLRAVRRRFWCVVPRTHRGGGGGARLGQRTLADAARGLAGATRSRATMANGSRQANPSGEMMPSQDRNEFVPKQRRTNPRSRRGTAYSMASRPPALRHALLVRRSPRVSAKSAPTSASSRTRCVPYCCPECCRYTYSLLGAQVHQSTHDQCQMSMQLPAGSRAKHQSCRSAELMPCVQV